MIRTPDLEPRAPWRRLAPLVVAVVTAVAVSVALPAAAGAATATVPTPPAKAPAAGAATGLPTPPIDVAACPWLASAMAAGDTPAALAELVVGRMTLAEKLGRDRARHVR